MKTSSALSIISLLLVSCAGKEEAPLLTGTVTTDDPVLVTAYYDVDGDMYLDEFSTDSSGNFTYSPAITEGTDLTLYINGATYGVRLDNGASVKLIIDSLGETSYEGDNIMESRCLNACVNGYDARRYKHIEMRDGAYVADKYMAMIDDTHSSVTALLPQIADESLRAYYSSLDSMFYNRTKANILQLDYHYNGKDGDRPYPEKEIAVLKTIDPNSDAARRTGALYEWGFSLMPGGAVTLAESMDVMCRRVDSLVANPANRRMLFNSCIEMIFNYNLPVDEMRGYVAGMRDRLTDHQLELLEKRIQEIENRTKDGDKIPCDPVLLASDGSKTTLADACGGKVAYIDLWATWCGPCCAQIPYMEKIAADYAGNDRVVCISISCDDDLDAWRRKLVQDNPEWPQYVFTGESGQQFMTAMGVTGIPRFIVINPDMTIASIDAPRPQNDEAVKTLIDGLL